jgi:hypothetical protein
MEEEEEGILKNGCRTICIVELMQFLRVSPHTLHMWTCNNIFLTSKFNYLLFGALILDVLTNCRWCQLRSQRSASTLAGNQLLPNAMLERNGKALINLFFCNPTHKTETETANTWELLPANHLDESLWLANQENTEQQFNHSYYTLL